MHKLLFIFFAIFPCMIGLSVAFLILKPEERINALIMLPIAIGGTVLTQYVGFALQKKETWKHLKMEIIATQIGGLVLAVVVFFIVFFNLD